MIEPKFDCPEARSTRSSIDPKLDCTEARLTRTSIDPKLGCLEAHLDLIEDVAAGDLTATLAPASQAERRNTLGSFWGLVGSTWSGVGKESLVLDNCREPGIPQEATKSLSFILRNEFPKKEKDPSQWCPS